LFYTEDPAGTDQATGTNLEPNPCVLLLWDKWQTSRPSAGAKEKPWNLCTKANDLRSGK